MKTARICLIVTLIMSGSGFLFSQEVPQLTLEQQEQFDSQKFTVTGFKIVTISRYGTSDSGFGPSSTNWEVTRGYAQISEPDFLRALGLDKEALDSEAHLKNKSLLSIGGVGLTIVGLVVICLPIFAPPMKTDQYGYSSLDMGAYALEMGAGLAIGLGGSIMWGVGVGMSPNITPYGRADNLAQKYNLQLVLKIQRMGPSDAASPDNGSI